MALRCRTLGLTMSDPNTELKATFQARRSALSDLIVSASGAIAPIAGGQAMRPEDLIQMVNGFLVLIEEALEGRSDTREFYLSTVMPGLRDSGTSAKQMLDGTSKVLFAVAFDLA